MGLAVVGVYAHGQPPGPHNRDNCAFVPRAFPKRVLFGGENAHPASGGRGGSASHSATGEGTRFGGSRARGISPARGVSSTTHRFVYP
jgi:hypothetical protein